ncbi:hypothetical protein ACH5RR_034015 [Cinchona calisaya]|uniref:Helicase C-terminal domain-containing protein n=1 Tax=Cinchona calisaya TaxID=153742 RepID=A0ABD2YDH6_9GENT
MNHLDRTNLMSLISVHPSLAAEKDFFVNKTALMELESNPDAGVKVKFVMELICSSMLLHEKVLVFCEYIPPLRFIMKQLEHKFSWMEGKEMLYMDGKRDVKDRQSSISSFNNPRREAKVLLASTRACAKGINLARASRICFA